MTSTYREDKVAAQRLALPSPRRWSVGDAEEARTCIGCTARYEKNVRVVYVVRGCPAHGSKA